MEKGNLHTHFLRAKFTAVRNTSEKDESTARARSWQKIKVLKTA